MKIKLKKGAVLEPTNNKHGLSLEDFYNLESGKQIEIKQIPDSLKGLVSGVQNGNK